MRNKDINAAERVLRGMLKEEFTPSVLICALYNVLACGKGHKNCGVHMNRADDETFTDLMESLEEAREFAKRIEGA